MHVDGEWISISTTIAGSDDDEDDKTKPKDFVYVDYGSIFLS